MPLDLSLDRSSPVPLYYQLAQQLEQAVANGDLKPGDRIEPEVDLAERTGLSRPTVRQAIQELVKKGLLVRRRGVGTQVVHNQMRRPVELSSLYDDLTRANHRPTTKVLVLRREGADADVASILGLGEAAEVYVIERLRFDGDEPLAYMRNWIPADIAELDETSLEAHGLYDLLRRAGVQMHIANQRIGAKVASGSEAKLLDVRTGAALLTMERTTFDDAGRAIEWASSSYRADLYSYETTLFER
jgi:DNA-binding GntR family transcriptional regulator